MSSEVNPPLFAHSTDGCRIAFWTAGNSRNPAIILLHGFALDHQVWDKQMKDPELISQFYLIAPDLRGHGQSGKPSSKHGYIDSRLWAADLATLIAASQAYRPVVVAWSFAGRMLNDYIQHIGTNNLGGINYIAAATLSGSEFIGPAHGLIKELCTPKQPDQQCADQKLFLKHALGLHETSSPLPTVMLDGADIEHRLWMREHAFEYDLLLKNMDVPVLISHGEQDTFVLPLLARQLYEVLAKPQLSLYSNAGHAPFYEQALRFNSELASFVKNIYNTNLE